jgi:hypothetical protein
VPLQAGVNLSANIMFPLQLSRIFDYQQPSADPYRNDVTRISVSVGGNSPTSAELIEERRKNEDRRSEDRRMQQHAIFLNTRKTQGRRKSPGRRIGDQENRLHYRPISLKG